MTFTLEQFKKLGNFAHSLDDLPLNGKDDEQILLRLFNALPSRLQGIAVQWGMSDTVFKDGTHMFLCENQFGMTVKEFYKQKMWQNAPRDIDFIKLEVT